MNFKFAFFKMVQNQMRLMSSSKKPQNHYDSLGIGTTSTQGEVKAAYYKLSMMYHPDKNQNNVESAEKFRDINEAYEVLGNVKTRKLYDKGLYFHGTTSTVDDNDTVNKFYKSRETRSRPPPPSGRTPIYDFDEWSKSHYGATFRRQMENKRRQHFYRVKRQSDANDVKMEKILFTFGVLFLISMFLVREETDDYDTVKHYNDSKKS